MNEQINENTPLPHLSITKKKILNEVIIEELSLSVASHTIERSFEIIMLLKLLNESDSYKDIHKNIDAYTDLMKKINKNVEENKK